MHAHQECELEQIRNEEILAKGDVIIQGAMHQGIGGVGVQAASNGGILPNPAHSSKTGGNPRPDASVPAPSRHLQRVFGQRRGDEQVRQDALRRLAFPQILQAGSTRRQFRRAS